MIPPVAVSPEAIEATKSPDRGKIIIVSGQPRSGTSLMMRLLDESGVPTFAGEKVSYECAATNILQTNNEWVLTLEPDTAIKVLWPQCLSLPFGPDYHFIWMRRDPHQQAASQQKFLGKGNKWRKARVDAVAKVNYKAPDIIRAGAKVLVVDFEELLKGRVAPIEKFIGKEITIKSIMIGRTPRAGVFPKGKLELIQGGNSIQR